jgi:hypothetical protein
MKFLFSIADPEIIKVKIQFVEYFGSGSIYSIKDGGDKKYLNWNKQAVEYEAGKDGMTLIGNYEVSVYNHG